MTVSTSYSPLTYSGNGATTAFSVTWPFYSGSLVVTLIDSSGVETVQTISTHYTVSGGTASNGLPSTGTVTMLTAPPSGSQLRITRNTTRTQAASWTNGGSFQAKTLESALDKLTLIAQESGNPGTVNDGMAGDVIELVTAGAVNYWDGENQILRNLANPTDSTDAVTKSYGDANYGGAAAIAAAASAVSANSSAISAAASAEAAETYQNTWEFLQSGTGAVERTFQDKCRDWVDARDFGVVADGSTDDTADLQAALTAHAGKTIMLPAGTIIVTTLAVPSNTRLVGQGMGATVIKRKNSAANNDSPISCTSTSGVELYDLTVDGNKANQTLGANNIAFASSSSYRVERVESINAKAASGYGSGLVDVSSTNGTNDKSVITGSLFNNNDGDGIFCPTAKRLVVSDCNCSSNGTSGISVFYATDPPVAFSALDISIIGNTCNSNATGINVSGFYEDILPGGAYVYGPAVTIATYIRIISNTVDGNDGYGIAYQGSYGCVSNNVSANNGAVAAFAGGYLFNGTDSIFSDNISLYDGSYGVDAGGSTSCIIANNKIIGAGAAQAPATGKIALNIGAARKTTVDGNKIVFGPYTGTGISASGIDGDGATPFPWLGGQNIIQNNFIDCAGYSGLGMWVYSGMTACIVRNNHVVNNLAETNYTIETSRGLANVNNTTDYGSTLIPSIASTGTMVIPDAGDTFVVTGTTTITSIRTYSDNVYNGKVSFVLVTDYGSGYTVGAPPTVSFSGGGGSGAAGTAEISNDGKLVNVQITNPGSGYTSAPSVSFSAGAAAAIAQIGVENYRGRIVRLIFSDVLTMASGGNLTLDRDLTTKAGTVLTLIGKEFGGWQEVSRSTLDLPSALSVASVSASGLINGQVLRATGDAAGASSSVQFSNVSDTSANSTGVGSIKFKGATSRDSVGFIKIYIGTTAYYVPVFDAITG